MDEIKDSDIVPPTNLPTDEFLEPEVMPIKPKAVARPRPSKPLVEGINAPISVQPILKSVPEQKVSNLTQAEKKLINSPVVRQSVNEPKPMSHNRQRR